ncbi:hypothetical protein [Actinoplanes derwentensis]|uniref:Lipoprotein n=1 Tax=Actinoplanes derwentensis TaxID=113562 RepID=A0A1H1U6B1_9ACTN|nr:hypothetical protein [Actinoplanes derwentensis]SDS67786.1 hypothetical protein SAMN04489716_1340 [Actinoplanes derwentensis]
MRFATAVLAGVSLLGLTACGDDEATSSAATPAAPAATSAQAATPEATSVAAAEPADKVICEDAAKASDSFKKALLTLAQAGGNGEIAPADAKLMLTDFGKHLTEAVAGSTTEVGKNAQIIADDATKAAAAADPISAVGAPESVKAGTALNAACKAAGVKTNF